MQLKSDKDMIELKSYIAHFYAISGVPGDNIEAPTVESHHVFLQSTTQEPKYLKKGSWLLYKVIWCIISILTLNVDAIQAEMNYDRKYHPAY